MKNAKIQNIVVIISLIFNIVFLTFLVSYSAEVADHNNRESIRTLESMNEFSQKLQDYLESDLPSDRIAIAEELHHAYGRILYGRSGIINIHVPFFFGDKAFYNTIQKLDNHVFATLYFSYITNRRETGEELSEEEKEFVSKVLKKFDDFHKPLQYANTADRKTRRNIVIEGSEVIKFTRGLE